MNMIRWIRMDWKRLWQNGHMLLVFIGSIWFGIMACATSDEIMLGNSVLNFMTNMLDQQIYLLSFMPAFFAYGCCFLEDFKHQYIRQELLEGRLYGYVFSKTLFVFFSSMITMGVETGGCAVILGLWREWGGDVETAPLNIQYTPYAELFQQGNIAIMFFLLGLQMGILSGILSLFAAWLSLYVENKILAGTSTVLMSMMLQFVGAKTEKYNLYQMFNGTMNYSFQGENWLLKCIVAAVISYILSYILIHGKIKRRLQND